METKGIEQGECHRDKHSCRLYVQCFDKDYTFTRGIPKGFIGDAAFLRHSILKE